MSFSHNSSKDNKVTKFDAISLSVASPEQILAWSKGEVTKPETINYRTQRPERDGLFCERIFGPTKNWECYCGKYKRIRYKGIVCERCGVEVTRSTVRRENMGHINLAVPVTHIWFLRSTPSRIGLLLNLPVKALEQVVYFAAYIIKRVDENGKKDALEKLTNEYKEHKKHIQEEHKARKKIDTNVPTQETSIKKIEELEEQYHVAKEELNSIVVNAVISEVDYRNLSLKFGQVFEAGTGAEALRDIITKTDLKKMIEDQDKLLKNINPLKHKKTVKRLKLASGLIKANILPEWMILTTLPVIPPDLRPMVQLDGGRFAASDLNDLYRRVINRNNRLKKLIEIGAPEVICRNEKRMLQEAVDTLLNNSARSGKNIFVTTDKRKLRSLSDMLKGKQGRFRQNLLGKRVDYSGRSVIVVGPKLKLHQCGLPKIMALELFKPFVIGLLIREGHAHNVKNAERLIQAGKKEVWDILERVTKKHCVLLNRAPTLHRLGIQAFQPVLIEGKAIQIHPLVCAAFNADFDGDQMAVHVPLSNAAQKEAYDIMLSSHNLLKPSAGEPIVTPTQDMILGCYYLTRLSEKQKGEGMIFSDMNEAITAYRLGYVSLQAKIKTRLKGKILETTIGRLIFNSFLPEELEYKNKTIDKKMLKNIVTESFDKAGMEKTALLVEEMKRIGFKFATKSGISISAEDVKIPEEKYKIIAEASDVVTKINNQYWKGWITENERYNHTIKKWSSVKNQITEFVIKAINTEDNDMAYSVVSGARGNWGQITQLAGLKGLVANPAGKTIELPIKSNLKEGFTILEYFIATHGGRKGKSDTALKTAEAGYLTRRLVDAVQNIVVCDADCGNKDFIVISQKESEKIGEAFENRIFGRTLAEQLIDPNTKEIIGEVNQEINHVTVVKIQEAGLLEIKVRSIMNCQSEGICQACYGSDLGTSKTVQIGTTVGIIAAQSIGEPGTQLTMRTFHAGGVAEEKDITQGLNRVEELFEARAPKSPTVIAPISGKIKIKRSDDNFEIIITSSESQIEEYEIPKNFDIQVKEREKMKENQILAQAQSGKKTIITPKPGTIILIQDKKIKIKLEEASYVTCHLSAQDNVKVEDGQLITAGDALTEGHFNLSELIRLKDTNAAQKYIMNEVQSIYAAQGQTINDKHLEVIIRQMFSKVRITDPGNSDLLSGEVTNLLAVEQANKALTESGKAPIKFERLLLGLTRAALYTDSWLSAASFQETVRVLVEAATTRKIDYLKGLKENVIIGKLIPAGKHFLNLHAEKIKMINRNKQNK